MEQMELNLQQAKQEIREEMAKTAQSFVIIGYRLRQILDSGAYMQDGYSDFNEFAKKEFGLSQSGTSRFISINKNYSEGGYGSELRTEYRGYSCSQLTEMLSLTEDDRTMISEDMPVAQIREVKDFVRTEEKMDGQTSLFEQSIDPRGLYLDMFQGKSQELRHLLEDQMDEKEVSETINPSGSRVFRHKTIMIVMGEQVTIRVFGGNQEKITYMDLLKDIRQNLTLADAQEEKHERDDHQGNLQKNTKKSEKAVKIEKKEPQTALEERKTGAVHTEPVEEKKSPGNVDLIKSETISEGDHAAGERTTGPVEVVEGEIIEDEPEIVERSIEKVLEAMRVIKEACIAENEKHDGCKMCPLYDGKRDDCAVIYSVPDAWNLKIKDNKIDLLGE